MLSRLNENTQAVLKQLWGSNVPQLTEDQIDLSIKVWQKIQARKQREQKTEHRATNSKSHR